MIIDNILGAELPLAYFDGIFVSNFFEHLPTKDSIGGVLAKLRASMETGGTLAVLGPNFRYCSGRYFDCADHYFDREMLARQYRKSPDSPGGRR